MRNVAELLVPAIRWDTTTGFAGERTRIARALELGVGGFVLHGGPEAEVRGLIKDLRQASKIPLLIGAELERGVGQQFPGTTGLPPLPAIASLNDANMVQRAAKLTAREARPLGVNWGFAPMCDLKMNPANVRTSVDAIAGTADEIGTIASHWIEACQHEGMLACAKHFPGAGRVGATNGRVPPVDVPRSILFENEFKPFRAAISSRVASMLVAHVSYPSLDASESPATFSSVILRYLLREKYGFEGLVASDVLQSLGPMSAEGEADVAMRALDAGCDVLLGPSHLDALVDTLDRCIRDGPLYEDRIEQSRRRRLKWAQWAAPQTDFRRVSGSDVAWAQRVSERVLSMVRGTRPRIGKSLEIVIVDDDESCPTPGHPRTAFAQALTASQIAASVVAEPTAGYDSPVYVTLFGELRGNRQTVSYLPKSLERVAQVCEEATRQRRDPVIVQFGPPVLASQIRGTAPIVLAWSGDRCMQEAVARWLTRSPGTTGSFPAY